MFDFGPARKIWAFFLFFSLIFLVVGYLLADRLGLFVGLALALLFHWILSRIDEHPLDTVFNPRPLEGLDPWNLNRRCAELANAMNMPAPRILLAGHHAIFAYLAPDPLGEKKLVISSALLDKLSKEETDALLIEMLCFARHTNHFVYGVASIFSRMILTVASRIDRAILLRRKGTITRRHPATLLVRPLVVFIQRLALPRRAFFEIDEESSSLLSERGPLAHALWKMSHSTQVHPLQLPPCTDSFFVVSPSRLQYLKAWSAAHPPVEDRIKRLMGTYPI